MPDDRFSAKQRMQHHQRKKRQGKRLRFRKQPHIPDGMNIRLDKKIM